MAPPIPRGGEEPFFSRWSGGWERKLLSGNSDPPRSEAEKNQRKTLPPANAQCLMCHSVTLQTSALAGALPLVDAASAKAGRGAPTSGNAGTSGHPHGQADPPRVGESLRTTNGRTAPRSPQGGGAVLFAVERRAGAKTLSGTSDPPAVRSGKESTQNPPTSERYMYDVSLRDPSDKRSSWCPTLEISC